MSINQKNNRFKVSLPAYLQMTLNSNIPMKGREVKKDHPHMEHQRITLLIWTVSQTGEQTQADRHLPARLTITQTGRQPVKMTHQHLVTTKKTRGGEGFYLYLNQTGRCAANSILPLSLPRWFVWAINRPPLLWPSTKSICLYPFIYQPACLAACLPVSVFVLLTVFPCSLSLSLSHSENTVYFCPSVIWILYRQAEEQL